MGNVRLMVSGRAYDISCADGDEPHLEHLASIVDDKAQQARAALGDVNEARQLLFAAIFLADELQNAQAKIAQTAEPADYTPQIASLVERIKRLSEALLPARTPDQPA